jgi:microsomal dipeptidase-like Zn-dependent dipeptidase
MSAVSGLQKTGIGVVAAALGLFLVVPGAVGRRLNRVTPGPPRAVSQRARALHARLLVADLHADSLLWGRDLTARSSWGHVDLPRLAQGNVALQAFTIVTKVPRGANIVENASDSDSIFWLALAQRWPPACWSQLAERALFQVRRLQTAADDSGGRLAIVRTRLDLVNALERRRRDPQLVAGLVGIEGAHALDGDLKNLDRLETAGVRMIGLAHFFDNDIAGSAHGAAKGGLSETGRTLVARMESRGMIVDLAHSSPRTIADVLSLATRPVVVSHTGVKGTCDNARNLDDDQLRAIAAGGGLIGIGYWETAVCGMGAPAIARAIRHAVEVAGPEHVGLGSDFDGSVTMPFDTTRLVEITDALLAEGLSEEVVERVMGRNEIDLLQRLLPGK